MAIVLLFVDRLLRGRARPLRTGRGTPRPPMRWRLGRSTSLWLLLLLCFMVAAAALAIPLWGTVSGLLRHLGGDAGALDAGKELTTTLLLQPTGEKSLATALRSTTNGEVLDFTAAAPCGFVLLVIGAVPAILLARAPLRR
ncbi:hypothetical protein GCM10023353_06530 [Tomitella cavernea]|uniref:Uncharacterized protein n=1 Tax=Tomitella cavernea TaxID=1387982 RepID=A0ABP9C7A1_9ACTN